MAGPGVRSGARTTRVEGFLTKYFTAINDHSYSRYVACLTRP